MIQGIQGPSLNTNKRYLVVFYDRDEEITKLIVHDETEKNILIGTVRDYYKDKDMDLYVEVREIYKLYYERD